MKKPISWNDFVTAFDYTSTHKISSTVERWESWEKIPTGVRFHCKTARDEPVEFRLDLTAEEILRVRMNPQGIEEQDSEILVDRPDSTPPFEVKETAEGLRVETAAVRVEFPRQPWGMQVFDRSRQDTQLPVFQQQTRDRAYGPGYEVPPLGFVHREDGSVEVYESAAVQPGEAFYGFGERFTDLNKWGQELEFWAVDSGNVTSYRAYKNIPFFISSRGYGMLVHSSFPMVFRMGSESNISYSFHIPDQQLDYFLIIDPDYQKILFKYAGLTGFAPVPPKWSFGFWISRCMYMSREETEAVVRGIRERGFPCDVISLDPYWMGEEPWCTYQWDESVFPEPAEMMRSFREQGVKTCLWVTPYLPEGTTYYQEAQDQGYLVVSPQGEPAPVLEAFAGSRLAAVDFTNPEAVSWWQSLLRSLLEMGAATFKTDFAEQAPLDAVYADGRTGLEMHNLYPLLYQRAAFELTEETFGRGLVWGRSGYAGSQRYPVQWGGDSYASFPQMVGQLRGLLGYGLSGVPFCSHDVGGFDYPPGAFDTESLEEYPLDSEVYVRWLQFGVFSSHLRAHGKQPREPWEYGEQAEKISRQYINLRYRLLPYIYSQAVLSARSGLPMVRPLLLEYQEDLNTRSIDLQYCFGPDFLVAPLLTREEVRDVYLPEGDWYDFWTKEQEGQTGWITVQAPLEKLPLWVRGGAVIPYGPEMDFVDQKPLDPLTLEFYQPAEEGSTVIYDEDREAIAIRYTCRQGRLAVETRGAPEEIRIFVYGADVSEIRLDGKLREIYAVPGGTAAQRPAS